MTVAPPPELLVVGAGGNVGAAAVRQLQQLGLRSRALVRDPARARPRLGTRADLYVGDLDTGAGLREAFTGVRRALLVTSTHSRQLEREAAAIRAAVEAGVEHLVKLSVVAAGPGSPLRHGRWQGEANRRLVESGLDHTILQMSFFMQNLPTMVHGGVLPSCAEDGRVSMIDAEDVGRVAAVILRHPPSAARNQTLVLTGPQALSFDDAARILSQALAVPIRHARVTPAQIEGLLRQFGADSWYARDVVVFNELVRDGRFAGVTPVVEEVAGAAPRSLDAFARAHADRFTSAASSGRPGQVSRAAPAG